MEENTKLLQDLNPLGSPHSKGVWLGGIVDLDLLFLFPQEYARIMGGIGEERQALQGQQWRRESAGRTARTNSHFGKKGGLL